MHTKGRIALVCSLMLLLWDQGGAYAAGYNFTLVDGRGRGFLPAINRQGNVAYYAGQGAGRPTNLEFWDGKSSRITIPNTSTDSIGSYPQLNDQNLVVLTMPNTYQTWAWDPVGGGRAVGAPLGVAPLVHGLNNAGDFVASGYEDGRTVVRRANALNGTSTVATRVALGLGFMNGAAAVGDDGTVAVYLRDNLATYQGLEVITGGHSTRVAEGFDSTLELAMPSVNASGTVAYGYHERNGPWSIRTWKDGTERQVAITGRLGRVSINDLGRILFQDFSTGVISVASDSGVERVIGPGDALLGSSVQFVEMGGSAFNEAGQVVFGATLADGRNAVVLATPVPEPACVAVIGALATGWVLKRRSRRAL